MITDLNIGKLNFNIDSLSLLENLFVDIRYNNLTANSVSRALNISESNLFSILKSADKSINTLPFYLEKSHIDLIVSRLAKELKRYYSKQKKRYNNLSLLEKKEYNEFYSIFDSYKIHTEEILSNLETYNFINVSKTNLSSSIEESFIDTDNKLFQDIVCVDKFDIEIVKEYLYTLIYDTSFLNAELNVSTFVSVRKAEINSALSIIKKAISKLKIKIKTGSKSLCSLFSFFYINFHYYIFSNDEEDHSTKRFLSFLLYE